MAKNLDIHDYAMTVNKKIVTEKPKPDEGLRPEMIIALS